MEINSSTNIRNIAVIAHVDHGKTTLVDFMLKQTNAFRENEAKMQETTILDSNPLEKERGITILAKNTAIFYKNTKINIIDTPGHADFSGEVERTLNMADGALLIIDSQEGPMPQTKFVLKKALEQKLKIIVVINKIDKPLADIESTLAKTNDLFLELAEDVDQLDFPVFYAIGREGKAAEKVEDVKNSRDLSPLLDAILNYIDPPEVKNGPFKMMITSLDFDSHRGKHLIGRIKQGTLLKGQTVTLIKSTGEKINGKIGQILTTSALSKIEVEKALTGDIVDLTGIENAEIGDTLTDPADLAPLERLEVEEPTLKITIAANTSPFAGLEGKFSNSRQILERLKKELETNISLRLKESGEGFILSGRGELHLSILLETLRREGYEFQVGKPQVITKMIDGIEMEPVEILLVDVPDEFVGIVTEEAGKRRAQMTHLEPDHKGNTRLEYKIPSKSLIGLRSLLLTKTRGTCILNTFFASFEPISPSVPKTRNGVLISSETGVALKYGLENAQGRGITFVAPGTKVYEGMIIGQNSRNEDIEINVTKEKKQTNMRSSTADMSITLTPHVELSLEQCLDFLEDDELLEITPLNLRLRKKYLTKLERNRQTRNL